MSTKKLISLLLALAMLCSLALGLISCGSTPDEEFKKLEKEAFENSISAISDTLENADGNASAAVKSNAKIHLDDSLIELLSTNLGMDFTWINDLSVDYTVQYKGSDSRMGLGLLFGEDVLLSMSAITDYEGGKMYASVPELFQKHLAFDTGTDEDVAALTALLEDMPDISAALPILEKYYVMLIDSVTNVQKSDMDLVVGTVAQKSTVYEVTLTEKEAATMVRALLVQLADDQDFKAVVIDLVEAANTLTADTTDPEEAYNELRDNIQDSINDIDEEVLGADADESVNEPFFTWKTFVNKKEIIGREISVTDDGETLTAFVGKAVADDKIGIDLSVSQDDYKIFAVSGEFTESQDLLGGSLTVTLDNKSLMYIDVADLDTKKWEKNHLSGSFSISLGEDLLEELDDDMSSSGLPFSISLSAVSLKAVIDSTDDTAKVTYGIYNGNTELASIEVNSQVTDDVDYTIPEASETVEDPEEWLKYMDLDGYLTYLSEDTELPDDVLALIYYLLYQGGF